jgi:hypothetical protein
MAKDEPSSSLTGSLEDVPVVDLLQFLHASGRTGTLELRNRDDVFYVVLHNGRILHASTPTRINLGKLLVEAELVSRPVVEDALAFQHDHPGELLGQILIRRGAVSAEDLANVVKRQIEMTLAEIVGWTRGTFSFYLEDHVPADDIRVSLKELLPISDVNTQFLLLEALRVFDEKKRSEPPPEPQQSASDQESGGTQISEGVAKTVDVSPRVCVASTSRPLVARIVGMCAYEGWVLSTPHTLKALEDWAAAAAEHAGPSLLLVDSLALAWNEDRKRGMAGFLASLMTAGPGISVVVLGSELAPEQVADLYAAGVHTVLPRPKTDESKTRGSSGPIVPEARGAWRAVSVVMRRLLGKTGGVLGPMMSRADRKSYPPELYLLETAREQVQKVQRSARELSVGLTFLEAVAEHFDRAVLMLRIPDALLVIGAFGAGSDGRSLSQSIPSGTRFSIAQHGRLAEVLADPATVCLETRHIDFPDSIAPWVRRPDQAAIGCLLPLVGVENAVGLVYCDMGANPDVPENVLETLKIVSTCAGLAMELAIARARLQKVEGP